jgi:hypothetical protein
MSRSTGHRKRWFKNPIHNRAAMKSASVLERMMLVAVAAALVCRTWILSPQQPMWLDEIYTFYAIDHPTWPDFWRSFTSNINAAPPGYFTLMWLAGRVVPLTELNLRIFSALCCGGAFAVTWSLLRRHADFFAATIGASVALLTSRLFLFHNSDARFYGLYLLAIAWAVSEYDRLCTAEPRRGWFWRNALSHALAVATAYVAGMFSAAILAAFVLRDLRVTTWRPKVYLSVIAGWFPVVLCLPFILAIGSAPKWIPKPGPTAAFHPFDPGLEVAPVYFIFAALAVLAAWRWFRGDRAEEPRESTAPSDSHLILLAALFLAVPYGVLALTWAGMPTLIDRYSLPALLAFPILLTSAIRSLLRGEDSTPSRAIKALAVAGMLVWPALDAWTWVRDHPAAKPPSDPDFVLAAPVRVTTDPHVYFRRHYYDRAHRPSLVFVARSAKIAAALRQFHPAINAVTVDELLARYPRFAVVADQRQNDWLTDELIRARHVAVERDERNGYGRALVVQQYIAFAQRR